MIFGRHINRYYLKYSPMLLLGIATLVMVDVLQLEIPELYQMVINGMNLGYVTAGGWCFSSCRCWRDCWHWASDGSPFLRHRFWAPSERFFPGRRI